MTEDLSRRRFLGLAGSILALPLARPLLGTRRPPFRIRAITAGVPLSDARELRTLHDAIAFLGDAREELRSRGYEVQTVRAATQPLGEYLPDWSSPAGIDALVAIDDIVVAGDVSFSTGPVITQDTPDPRLAAWAVDLVARTRNVSISARVASPEGGVHRGAARSTAAAIEALGRETPGGEGNFRFAAAAFVPAGTPFFPAGWFDEPRTFSIGLESPPLLDAILSDSPPMGAHRALAAGLDAALGDVVAAAEEIAAGTGWRFLGIDASPAPGLDASIGEVVERLSGAPFGDPSTLAACALLTDVLKGLSVPTCGYSGLMLPVLEDRVLAQRAGEGRYGVAELLLYSSVCGTGLDVVPLPGDTAVGRLEALVVDVAALATKHAKPLSVRLLPIPGLRAGEIARFENPYLTDTVVMEAG